MLTTSPLYCLASRMPYLVLPLAVGPAMVISFMGGPFFASRRRRDCYFALRGRDGGLLFPCRKSNKSALKGGRPLENPLNVKGLFPSGDTLACSSLVPSLVRRTSAAAHLFYRRRVAAAPLLGSDAPATLPGWSLAAGQ